MTPSSLTLRSLFASAVVIASLNLGACSSRASTDSATAETAPLTVRTQVAAEHDFERRLSVQGSLESRNYASVAARSAGNLDAILVAEGDTVIAGETVLFQIDPTSHQNALTIAQQDLAVAKSSLTVARASLAKVEAEARKATLDYERYKRLHEADKISDSDFERAEMGYAQAQAGIMMAKAQADLSEQQVRKAEAALAISAKNLEDTRVIAPISGTVTQRHAEPGEFMSVGRVLLRIDDLSHIEAAAFIPAQYYADVIPGETMFRLRVNQQDSGTHTVTYRSPTIDTSLRTFEIKGKVFPVSNGVVPGNMADLSIVFSSFQSLGIPENAVIIRNGQPTVFVIEDAVARQQTVTTGLNDRGWIEIKEGLKAGDVVVVEGQTLLRDSQRVTVR